MKTALSPFKIILLLLLILFSAGIITAQDEITIGKYDRLYSKVMNEERTLLISLPDDYDKNFDTYPVLYVLDGSVRSLTEAKANLQMSKYSYSPDMIIVAIRNTDRNRDMLPGDDAAPKFLKFITEELVPYIKSKYRVDEKHRVLYGGSNAGLFTMFAFLENPENFSGYIISSPTICHRKQLMMSKIKNLVEKNVKINKAMYLIYGDVDYPEIVDTLNVFLPWLHKLESNGLKLKVDYLSQDGHVPFGSLEFGLMSIYEGYSYPIDKLENEALDSMKAYYERYSQRVGYKQKPPKEKILFFGQELLRKGKINEAVDAFEYACGIYPEDYYCKLLLAISHFKSNSIELARKGYFETKEIMKKIKEYNDPPLDEWKQMKKKFE